MQYNDKHKDKIKKLLELSMSDNENEANIALKQAMSLMNKHNLTKEEVYGQKMISKTIETNYVRIPAWYSSLYATMGNLSGCLVVSSNGRSELGTKAKIQIAGRQRDVENAIYLTVFLSRELEKSVEKYKSSLPKNKIRNATTLVKSYRMGFINNLFQRMQASRNQFFTDTNSHNQVICVDHQSRISEAQAFFCKENNVRIKNHRSQARYDQSGLSAGRSDADKLQINNAVNRQDQIHGITYN